MSLKTIDQNSIDSNDIEATIAGAFSTSANGYDENARVQKTAALWLEQNLFPEKIEGRILEVGCGTGILSNKITAAYPKNPTILSDISGAMLTKCQAQIAPHENVSFQVLNGQNLAEVEEYGAIFTSFTLQWVLDLSLTLKNLLKALQAGGHLVAAIQGSGSYPEWRAACQSLDLPYLANPMPSVRKIEEILKGERAEVTTETITSDFPKAIDFFKELKHLGASTSTVDATLAYKDFKALLGKLDVQEKMTMTTEVIYLKVTK